jgi:hypothetical protein
VHAFTDPDYLERRGEDGIQDLHWTMSRLLRSQQRVELALDRSEVAFGSCRDQFFNELQFDASILAKYRDYPEFMRAAMIKQPVERRTTLISLFQREGVIIPARYMDGVANFVRTLASKDNDIDNIDLLDSVTNHFEQRLISINNSSRKIEKHHNNTVNYNLFQLLRRKLMIQSANAPNRFEQLRHYRDFCAEKGRYVGEDSPEIIALKVKAIEFMEEILKGEDNPSEASIDYIKDYAQELLTDNSFADILNDEFLRGVSVKLYLLFGRISFQRLDFGRFIKSMFMATLLDIALGGTGVFDKDMCDKVRDVMQAIASIDITSSIYQQLLVISALQASNYSANDTGHSPVPLLMKQARKVLLENFERFNANLNNILSSNESQEMLQAILR